VSQISAGRSLAYYAAEIGLTKKQRAFVECLLADPERNQTLAATRAGYGAPAVTGSKLVRTAKIKQYMDLVDSKITQEAGKRANQAVMPRAEVRARLSDQARGGLVSFFRADGTVNLQALQEQDKGHLVKKLVMNTITKVVGEVRVTETEVRAEPTDPQGALKELAAHYGLNKDKAQVQPQINLVQVVNQMDPKEQTALREGLRALTRGMLQSGAIDVEAE
jgi:phage terminase small subunit